MSYMGDQIDIPMEIPQFQVEDSGWGADDFAKLFSSIGSTFASTYGAVNGPGAGYAQPYAGSPPPPATSMSTSTGFTFDQLFTPPYLYFVIGAGILLVVLMAKKGE